LSNCLFIRYKHMYDQVKSHFFVPKLLNALVSIFNHFAFLDHNQFAISHTSSCSLSTHKKPHYSSAAQKLVNGRGAGTQKVIAQHGKQIAFRLKTLARLIMFILRPFLLRSGQTPRKNHFLRV
jgi:hypothetical protein